MKSSLQYCRILNKYQSSLISFSESFVTAEISATESFPCSSSIFAISRALLYAILASSKSFIIAVRIYLALKLHNFTSFCKTLNTGSAANSLKSASRLSVSMARSHCAMRLLSPSNFSFCLRNLFTSMSVTVCRSKYTRCS